MSLSGRLHSPRPGESIAASHIATLADAIRDRTPISSPSVQVIPHAGGFSLETVTKGGGVGGQCNHNWKPKSINSELISVSPGEVAGLIPTIGGNPMTDNPRPELAVDAEELQYIYAKVNASLITMNDFYVSATFTNAVVEAHSSVQTSTDSERYFLLFTWQAGRLVDQIRRYNISIAVRGAVGSAIWFDGNASS